MEQLIIFYQVLGKDGVITQTDSVVVEATEENKALLEQLIKQQTTNK